MKKGGFIVRIIGYIIPSAISLSNNVMPIVKDLKEGTSLCPKNIVLFMRVLTRSTPHNCVRC